MYDTYFGFAESPFENNLDQRFLFLSQAHKEVLGALFYFVEAKKSFAVVCGDVGTGKTMLINFFLQKLPESVHPVMVSNPYLSPLDLLLHLAETLKIGKAEKKGLLDLTNEVKEALIRVRDEGQQLVLIVDEAHLLSDQALEEIRLLSNLGTSEKKLFQILLVGQNELSYKLDRPEMRHLRRWININRFLSPMNSLETVQYIDYRLKEVGSSFASIFEPNSQNLLFRMTRGVPRRINQICDNALLIAMAEGVKKVSPKILKAAEEAVQTDLILTPKSSSGWGGLFKRSVSLRIAVVTIVAVLLVVIISFNGNLWLKKLPALSYKNPELIETPQEKKFSYTAPAQMADSSEREPLAPQVKHSDLYGYFPGYRSVPSDPASCGLTKDQGKTNIQVPEKERPSTVKEVLPGTIDKDQPENLPLKEVLINMQKAHAEKNISKFMDCFSRTFPQRYKKRRNTLMILKSYDLLNMIFTINDVKRIDSDSYEASVTWIYEARNRYSNKIKPYKQQYEIQFINEDGQWVINSLKKKR
jgi:type II secretory pathway predicted ATPase ExeA